MAHDVGPAPDSDPVGETPPASTSSRVRTESPIASAPEWVAPMIRRALWRVLWMIVGSVVVITAVLRARGIVSMVVIALFFGIAMDPAVTYLHTRRGWRRGLATGAVFLALALFVVVTVFVLVPGMVDAANQISARLPAMIDKINQTFGISIDHGATPTQAAQDLHDEAQKWVRDNAQQLLGFATSIVGLVFQFFTIAMFTFYFAADAPRIRKAVLTQLPPDKQQRIGWAWDTAIQQTGGYFYSRVLLMGINGGLFFFAMLVVGVNWTIALPLSIFEGFVAEFIPAVGTYIGAAVPIIVTLGLRGGPAALGLLVWTLVYQQLENYLLSPRLSARTMEINGGVAFGSALAGGAIAGPMGAFMALPAAAMVTAFMRQYVRRYELAYHSAYDRDRPQPQPQPAARSSA